MQQGLLRAIRYFGSQKALARALGVKQQAVSNWLNRQCNIPYLHVIKIACLTKGQISPHELAPDDPLSTGIFELFKILHPQESIHKKEENNIPHNWNHKENKLIPGKKNSRFKIEFEKIYERKNIFREINKKFTIQNYVKICSYFWEEIVNNKMKRLKGTLVVVSLYVQTCRHANRLGIYHLPSSYIACDTGLDDKKVLAALKYLQEINFCSYDSEKEYIWIHEMAIDQIGEKLDPKDELVELINVFFHSLPDLSFLDKFYQLYSDRFLLTPR